MGACATEGSWRKEIYPLVSVVVAAIMDLRLTAEVMSSSRTILIYVAIIYPPERTCKDVKWSNVLYVVKREIDISS